MKKHALIQRALEQMPPETGCSLTQSQIEALHRSALSLPKTNYLINIRWSLSLLGKGFYIVFFIGKERRSRKRLSRDKDFQVLPRAILILVSLLGCATILGLAYGQRMLAVSKQHSVSNLEKSSDVIHPTVVPFKYDQEQCETSFREWKDGQCIDYEHDHKF